MPNTENADQGCPRQGRPKTPDASENALLPTTTSVSKTTTTVAIGGAEGRGARTIHKRRYHGGATLHPVSGTDTSGDDLLQGAPQRARKYRTLCSTATTQASTADALNGGATENPGKRRPTSRPTTKSYHPQAPYTDQASYQRYQQSISGLAEHCNHPFVMMFYEEIYKLFETYRTSKEHKNVPALALELKNQFIREADEKIHLYRQLEGVIGPTAASLICHAHQQLLWLCDWGFEAYRTSTVTFIEVYMYVVSKDINIPALQNSDGVSRDHRHHHAYYVRQLESRNQQKPSFSDKVSNDNVEEPAPEAERQGEEDWSRCLHPHNYPLFATLLCAIALMKSPVNAFTYFNLPSSPYALERLPFVKRPANSERVGFPNFMPSLSTILITNLRATTTHATMAVGGGGFTGSVTSTRFTFENSKNGDAEDKPDMDKSNLIDFAYYDDVEGVALCLAAGKDPCCGSKSKNGVAMSALHAACYRGSELTFLMILGAAAIRFPILQALEVVDATNATLLHWASLGGNVAIVRYLLDAAPHQLTATDRKGRSPVHYAFLSDCTTHRVIRTLLAAGGSVNEMCKDSCNPLSTVLLMCERAAQNGWTTIASQHHQLRANQGQYQPQLPTFSRRPTVFGKGISLEVGKERLQLLLDNGADIEGPFSEEVRSGAASSFLGPECTVWRNLQVGT